MRRGIETLLAIMAFGPVFCTVAGAICQGAQTTYLVCAGHCVPGQINVMECDVYNCADDTPTGRRQRFITNVCE
ncbi:MAG: hypothetical protein HRF46_03050 [Acidobacteriota bacterium]|jgi:hypothetical protein